MCKPIAKILLPFSVLKSDSENLPLLLSTFNLCHKELHRKFLLRYYFVSKKQDTKLLARY